jgi:hypothetical protein
MCNNIIIRIRLIRKLVKLILKMSNHSRSLEVSNDTDDIVSGHATDASRSSSRNNDSLGIHQHNDGWSEVTNENEVSGEVDSLIDGIFYDGLEPHV